MIQARQTPLTPENVPPRDRSRTVAHLASTMLTAVGHVQRHVQAAQSTKDPSSITFNLQHAATHVDEAHEHAQKLIAALAAYHPDVADELDKLHETTRPAAVPRGMSGNYDATGSGRDPYPV